jgi:TatA/E family protein of Tat protein translocase
MSLAFLSFSFGEMLMVALVSLLVFGGRLPEVMRNLGRAYARFRAGMNDATRPLRDEMRRLDERTRREMSAITPARFEPPPMRYEPDAHVPKGPPAPLEPPPAPAPRARGVADEPPTP